MRFRLTLVTLFLAAAIPGAEITHGPILGRLSSDGIGVWARTARPGEFRVRYGTSPTDLDQLSEPVRTTLEHDNTGWAHIQGLRPNTTYYYQVDGEPGARTRDQLGGDFRTLPTRETFRHARHNPDGLFNFSFEYACGNNQPADPSLPTFRTMLDKIEDKVNFAILDGDWLYEEKRDYSPGEWRRQVAAERTPRIVELAPTIVGVWENYKLYLSRGKNLADWHREVPSFFMFDDHETLNDVNGSGSPGLRLRRPAFRDIGLEAWDDYLGWSNPVGWKQDIYMGRTRLRAGSDVLVDEQADFRELKLEEAATLMVHWGTPDAGVNQGRLDSVGGDPNAGVYAITEVMGRNRL
ncbi:MAG: alkaline phosphatase, partial [bacterium]|nr:alkaline phosphatase [bacterium]